MSENEGHGPDQQSAEEHNDIEESQNSRRQVAVEDKKLTEVNGEIGYYVKKGTQFIPMTNFSVTCTGYVTENSQCNSSEGFLFNVLPKTAFAQGDDDNDQPQKRLVKATLYNYKL